ncbi:MAG: hypothetical protein WD929_00550 [Steroidobacteraceae bacterium]
MNARLNGFLEFLDLLDEGQRLQAESIAGRRFHFEPELEALAPAAKVLKFPLSSHQKARLFQDHAPAKVTTVN